MKMDLDLNKKVVREFIDAIHARDWRRLDAVVARDFVRHSCAAPPIYSRDGLESYLRSEFEIFPDAVETIEDIVAEGDRVAVRHAFRGTQSGAMGPYPASGRLMRGQYLAIYRLAEGVIAEAWVEWDNLSGLVQLGHLTSGTP